MSKNKWFENGMEGKIRDVLRDIKESPKEKDHKFDPPFVTAYQLAIALVERDEELCSKLVMSFGGKDCGEAETLPRYIANQLSRRIHSGEITDIEGAYLSIKSIKHLEFTQDVVSSATEPISLFRLK